MKIVIDDIEYPISGYQRRYGNVQEGRNVRFEFSPDILDYDGLVSLASDHAGSDIKLVDGGGSEILTLELNSDFVVTESLRGDEFIIILDVSG